MSKTKDREPLACIGIVMRLLQIAKTWEDKADAEDREWYNDSAAYRECADDIDAFAKTVMPTFECCWCRDHANLEPDEYTYQYDDLGGWCEETNQPICKECKWAADDAA